MQPVPDRGDERSFHDVRVAAPRAVPLLRRAVVDLARCAGADEQQCQAVRLALSEAVTNVVLHAYGDEVGLVHVSARVAGEELSVLVGDDGRGLSAPSPRPGLGQGLVLIGAVSDSVAVMRRPSGGTELHLRFGLRARPAAPRRHAAPRVGAVQYAQTAA